MKKVIGIGNILWNFMEDRKYPKKLLNQGLCSQSTVSKLFSNASIPDYFIMERILDRASISLETVEYIISQEEYEMCVLRKNIEYELRSKEYEKAQEMLDTYLQYGKGNPVHEQYYYRRCAYIILKKGQKEDGIELLRKSILCTMPEQFSYDGLYGVEELNLQLLYHRFSYKYGYETREQYQEFLENIERYAREKVENEELKGRCYPKIMKEYATFLLEEKKYEEAKERCKTGIKMLTERFLLDGLLGLYQLLKSIYEKIEVSKEERYETKKICETLEEIYEEHKIDKEDPLFYQELRYIRLDWEIMKKIRSASGISQEKLGDELYTQESISRIEKLRRKPSRKKMRELLKRQNIHTMFYDFILKTMDLELLQWRKQLRYHEFRRDYDKVRELLIQIKSRLEKEYLENQQFLLYYYTMVKYWKKELNSDEAIKYLEQALNMTLEERKGNIEGYLTQQELYILNAMATSMNRNKERQEALQLWKELLKYFDNGIVEEIFLYDSVGLILSNISKILEELDYLEESKKIEERGMRLVLESGKAFYMGDYIHLRGWLLERRGGDKKKAYHYQKQAFWIFYIFKQEKEAKILRDYYKKLTESDLLLPDIE